MLATETCVDLSPRLQKTLVHQNENSKVRQDLLARLSKLGVDPTIFQTVPTKDLNDIIEKLTKIVGGIAEYSSRRQGNPTLSVTDGKILKSLNASTGRISSLQLSRQLGIPLSTVQRRRRRLESNFIETSYSLRVEKFGWKGITIFISTQNNSGISVARELLSWEDTIIQVNRVIGRNDVDLIAECVLADNEALVKLIERVKSLGVRSVSWSESVEIVGYRPERFAKMIESLVKGKSGKQGQGRSSNM